MDFYKYQRLESSKKGLKSKQIFIWFFLLLVVILIATVAFYGVFIILGKQAAPLIEPQKSQTGGFVTPTSNITIQKGVSELEGAVSFEEGQSNIHFLYGVFISDSGKYRIYRVDYGARAVREIFSFPWKDPNRMPAISQRQENIAIYVGVNNGFVIDRNGKIVNHQIFTPPYSDFSVSDDGKKMFYFKYLSSTGSKSLVLRDLSKNEDLRIWPSGSEAARDCAFTGWDSNNINAYCIYKEGRKQVLRVFNSVNFSYSDINTTEGAVDLKFYPKLGYILKTFPSSASVYDINAKKNITTIQVKEEESLSHSFLNEEGNKIFYKITGLEESIFKNNAHIANIDGSEDVKILENVHRIISISPDSMKVFFEQTDESDKNVFHYLISNIDGSSQEELFSGIAAQFIGWF